MPRACRDPGVRDILGVYDGDGGISDDGDDDHHEGLPDGTDGAGHTTGTDGAGHTTGTGGAGHTTGTGGAGHTTDAVGTDGAGHATDAVGDHGRPPGSNRDTSGVGMRGGIVIPGVES